MGKIKFNFDIRKIIELLSTEIYDSPFALLRENVQNAYDAILMRQQKDNTFTCGTIKIDITSEAISIEDNGIGMSETELREHYWTAGSSGKNNADARAAGVVGTFGIGAMANFGVCSCLEVITKSINTNKTLYTVVNEKDLSATEDCIHLDSAPNEKDDFGTKVVATFKENTSISPEDAKHYISQYVEYLPIDVLLNGELISKKKYNIQPNNISIKASEHLSESNISFDYSICINNTNNLSPQIYVHNIIKNGQPLIGDIYLSQQQNSLFGLRNGFGLASIPIATTFNLGGVVNMLSLIPTAGREAISRESIAVVSSIISVVEKVIAKFISSEAVADNSRELIQYIRNNSRFDLAEKIQIRVANTDKRLCLGDITQELGGKKIYYYLGKEQGILNNYKGADCIVLLPSDDYNRRSVQLSILKSKEIQEIPDQPTLIKVYEESELSTEELSVVIRIAGVMDSEYLLPDSKVSYAEISHGLSMMATKEGSTVHVYIKRESSEVSYLQTLYKDDYDLFGRFVTDFVRSYLYPRFSQYVPSSTKMGADTLYKLLQQKRELYTIEYSDMGSMDGVMKKYLNGDIEYSEVLIAAKSIKSSSIQTVKPNQVGDANVFVNPHEDVLVKNNQDNNENHNNTVSLEPTPPILRREIDSKYKVLRTEDANVVLNNFKCFLALSDKVFKTNLEFFLEPHTTRVIWSMHKIIYVFTHASNGITLYYEMELETKLDDNSTGGMQIPTTTIITKNKLFIPVIPELAEYFNIKDVARRFYVHFDTVRNM